MKIFKIILSFLFAVALISLGVFLKQDEGYLLETEEDVVDAIHEVGHLSISSTQILNSLRFEDSRKDFNINVYCVGDDSSYSFYIFKENKYQKYEFYYKSELNKKGMDYYTITDYKNEVIIAMAPNLLNKFSHFVIGYNLEADENLIQSQYMMKCFEAQTNTDSVLLVDRYGEISGETTEGYTIE